MKDELHSIQGQPECNRCKLHIDHINGQYKETKAKYDSLKLERESLLKKVKKLREENYMLESELLDLRIYDLKSIQAHGEEPPRVPSSPQFSEDSMERLERGGGLKPMKSQGHGN